MKIAVCEDMHSDATALCEHIEDYFSRMGYMGEVTTFETGEELLAAFTPGAFSIVFLDIYLPGLSGMDTARRIREADPDCLLIFVTVSLDHAMDGFEVRASGYVVKPLDRSKMDKALFMCREVLQKNALAIEIPTGRDTTMTLLLPNIQYLEVLGNRLCFHLHGGVFEARMTLGEAEAMVGGEPFLRCHKSYVVNMNHVERVGSQDLTMKNGDIVPMRINGRNEVKAEIARFLAGRTAGVSV